MNQNDEEEMISIRDPEDIIGELPKDLIVELFDSIASDTDTMLSMMDHLSAAYVYERKSSYSTDNFGRDRNPSYGRPNDDILVQVTYRVPVYRTEVREVLDRVEKTVIRNQAEDAAAEAVRKVREAEEHFAALVTQLREAEARLQKAKSDAK